MLLLFPVVLGRKQIGVGADAFRKDLIELAGDSQLVLLQFGEAANHEGVLEVG